MIKNIEINFTTFAVCTAFVVFFASCSTNKEVGAKDEDPADDATAPVETNPPNADYEPAFER